MLNELISRANLEEMAGATAFQRGETYFAEGAVGLLRATDDKLTARVEGSEIYQVELWGDDDELAYDCTCPRAADGYFCKHCVAVGLAWLGSWRLRAPTMRSASIAVLCRPSSSKPTIRPMRKRPN